MTPSFIHYYPEIGDIDVHPEDVLDIFHETDRSEDNPVVLEVMQVYENLRDIARICGGYTIFENIEILHKKGIIKINDRSISPHIKISGYMKNAEKIAIFICTAGSGFSEFSKQYNDEGEYLKGYIVDTFGSVVVEKAINYIQKQLETKVSDEGLRITNRYSPGYCNWAVDDQKEIFSLLPDNKCSISLSKSCLMNPIKSVSGIIGIGKNVKKNSYACDICNNLTCIYRKVKNKRIK